MTVSEKVERTLEALSGGSPKPVPASVWYHFDAQHVAGESMARAHLEHLSRYDLDYLKVMNDNAYDLPEGIGVIKQPSDWRKLEPLRASAPGFVAQFEGLRILAKELGGRVMMTTTVFNVFASAQKLCGRKLLRHLAEDRESTLAGLETVSRSLCVLARESIASGADGVFLACSGNAIGELSSDAYRQLIKPHDEAVLKAAGEGTFNFVHVHGDGIDLSVFVDLPGDCLNWNSHRNSPNLREALSMTKMCLVGGWDQTGPIAGGPEEAIAVETRDALKQTGGERLLLGPGCTIPSDTPASLIKAAMASARREGV